MAWSKRTASGFGVVGAAFRNNALRIKKTRNRGVFMVRPFLRFWVMTPLRGGPSRALRVYGRPLLNDRSTRSPRDVLGSRFEADSTLFGYSCVALVPREKWFAVRRGRPRREVRR